MQIRECKLRAKVSKSHRKYNLRYGQNHVLHVYLRARGGTLNYAFRYFSHNTLSGIVFDKQVDCKMHRNQSFKLKGDPDRRNRVFENLFTFPPPPSLASTYVHALFNFIYHSRLRASRDYWLKLLIIRQPNI